MASTLAPEQIQEELARNGLVIRLSGLGWLLKIADGQ